MKYPAFPSQRVSSPADLRRSRAELAARRRAARLRARPASQRTGGHLSSNLGTVELTIALHYVFDTPPTGWCGTSATRPIRTRC